MSLAAVFGIPRLDAYFADTAAGQPLLITNEPGVDPRPFLLQALACKVKAGGHIVYLSTDRSPMHVQRTLSRHGTDTRHITFLDAFSALHGIPDPDHAAVDANNIADVLAHLEQAAQAHPEALFILDSLNGLVRHGAGPVAAAVQRLVDALGGFQEALVVFTDWHEEVALRPLLDAMPHVVHLSAVQQRIITSQFFRVVRAGGQAAEQHPVLYRADDDGRVRVYIPKIVVAGPADAGKSTFIHSASSHAVSTEQMGSTVAMDKGVIDHQGLRVDLFGTPGQERFDAMHPTIMSHAVGIVFMVDSTAPGSFERAGDLLHEAWRHGIQLVVAANKQDLPGALSPQDVRERLQVPEGTPVLGCVATGPRCSDDVLVPLLDNILSPPQVIA